MYQKIRQRVVILLLLLIVGIALSGCATKNKCVSIAMLSDNSRVAINTPGTDYLSISLGSANLEGKNRYQSCPAGEDPEWMTQPIPVEP